MTKNCFIREVFGDAFPARLAEVSRKMDTPLDELDLVIFQEFYDMMGGGRKGIAFKDLVSGLVLLTKGSSEERIRCNIRRISLSSSVSVCWIAMIFVSLSLFFCVVLFSLFSSDGQWILQCDMESMVLSLEGAGQVPKSVRQLFMRSSTVRIPASFSLIVCCVMCFVGCLYSREEFRTRSSGVGWFGIRMVCRYLSGCWSALRCS